MIWPQVSLAQMAALLDKVANVGIIDAMAERMDWTQFEAQLADRQPLIYLTQVAAPTLENDLRGVRAAKSLGAATIAFGTHVTPQTGQTMQRCPELDFVIRGEPELTLIELFDMLALTWGDNDRRSASSRPGRATDRWLNLLRKSDKDWRPSEDDWQKSSPNGGRPPGSRMEEIKGLAWRRGHEIVLNAERAYIKDLDDLPLPRHDLLPLDRYRMPMIKGPFSFVVTSRGCPANCIFCIKHLTYGRSVRIRSPENIVAELRMLKDLGLRNVHMYSDLFTVDREQVQGLCELMLQERLDFRWTCNSRVDFVDEELLHHMAQAGCWMISWGIESASPQILRRARKGYQPDQVGRALRWARESGIKNWGYFIIGLPGETETTVRLTIDLAKRLPLDLCLFHIAAPYPGTPLFQQALDQGWLRQEARWEEVDMDRSTVLDYSDMPAERIEYWARRAFREWAFRPVPVWTYLTQMLSPATLGTAVRVGLESLGWATR